MNIDLKSLVAGVVMGGMLMLALGAGRDSGGGIGFAVPGGGKAVVKERSGDAFIIDVDSGRAERILFKNPEPSSPKFPNNINGYELKLAD